VKAVAANSLVAAVALVVAVGIGEIGLWAAAID